MRATMHAALPSISTIFILLQQKPIMKTKCTLFFLAFTIAVNIPFKLNAQAVNVQDSLALVDLYNSTDGPHWVNNTNWLTGPVKIWYGITVKDDRIEQINLNYENLNGTLPPSLGNFVKLKSLILYANHLQGSIPSELGNLTLLTSLNLYGNQLSGTIPSELGNLINLSYLSLGVNQLNGSIPASLGNLINLSYIELGTNQLNSNIPASLGNLINLSSFDLHWNQLTGSIPSSLGNLINLQ